MLCMIEPMQRTHLSLSEQQLVSKQLPGAQKAPLLQTKDVLILRKEHQNMQTGVLDKLWLIWTWIKTNILCCFFEDEEKGRLQTEFHEFQDMYLDYEKQSDGWNDKERTASVKFFNDWFKGLDSSLQKRLKKKLFDILKEVKPDASTKEIHTAVKRQLEQYPFNPVEAQKPGEMNRSVVTDAILKVAKDLRLEHIDD